MTRAIQHFHVGIKAFIVHGDRLLMVKGNATDPRWELPGGRVNVGEELLPAQDILLREIHEELGSGFQCSVGKPVATWSRQLAHSTQYVYLIGFDCQYVSGDIFLSDEHTAYRWVTEDESRKLSLADGHDRALDQFWKNR